MFVGHYAPVFALKAVSKSPSLAVGFIAVQLVDIGFFSLSYAGIEKWRHNPALSGFMPVDLYYMPYTHSLAASMVWAVGAGMVMSLLLPAGQKLLGAVITSVLVLSHWFLDLVVHRPDLPLLADAGHKYGYALWDAPLIMIPLELGLLLVAFSVYMNTTKPKGRAGHITPWILLTVLFAAQFVNWFTPPAEDVATFSMMGLAAYLLLAALAWVVDRTRN